MATPEKPSLDLPSPERSGTATTRDNRETEAAKPSSSAQENAGCPELGDLLGDYSEQTGSFFE